MDALTTKQFGDACEHLVLAELMLAGHAVHKMPDGWKGYDVLAEASSGQTRISVKGLRAAGGKLAGFWFSTQMVGIGSRLSGSTSRPVRENSSSCRMARQWQLAHQLRMGVDAFS
jgi:hypothetical protein